jgi:hypothetical protein
VGENIDRSRAVLKQPLTGMKEKGRVICLSVIVKFGQRLRKVKSGYVKKNM